MTPFVEDTKEAKDVKYNQDKGNIVFSTDAGEQIKITAEGEFFVQGRKVTTDEEVYKSVKDYFINAGVVK